MVITAKPGKSQSLPCTNMALKCPWRYFTDRCLQPHGLCPQAKPAERTK